MVVSLFTFYISHHIQMLHDKHACSNASVANSKRDDFTTLIYCLNIRYNNENNSLNKVYVKCENINNTWSIDYFYYLIV